MAKKKQAQAAAAATIIDTTAELARDAGGFGALPGVQHDAKCMTITPAQGEATIEQLAAQSFETEVVTLRELAADDVGNAADALAELVANDTLTCWNPAPPKGDGWTLAAVLYHLHKTNISNDEVDAVAIFARPLSASDAVEKPEAPFDPKTTQAHAAMFLVGNLMNAAKRRFVDLAVPWRHLSEEEQARTLRNLADDVRMAVGEAIRAIASNERITFRAEVESVNFKGATDVKAALKLVTSPDAHSLADVAGGFVTVIIEDTSDLLSIPEGATAGEPDNRPLFDASTEGTALDTEREEVAA